MNPSDVSLPKGYLQKRAELARQTQTKGGLVASMNRSFGDGVSFFTKSDLGDYGHENWTYITELIEEWESRGLLRVIKPINVAVPSEIVIEMLSNVWPEKSSDLRSAKSA